MNKKEKYLFVWLGAAAVITIIFGTIYGIAQQNLRQGANDPQIQISKDVADSLNAGQSPTDLVSGRVNINNSLSPFIVIYDKAGNVVAGNGYLDGQIAIAPFGTLSASANTAYNAVTWAPYSNLRIATVSVAANNYFIFSGRSLLEVEKREGRAFKLSLVGWSLSVFSVLVAFAYVQLTKKKRKHIHHATSVPAE